MRRLLPFTLCALILNACVSQTARDNPVDRRLPVWIDTDISVGVPNRDVDDGLALLQAFHSPELKVIGVSAVFGNAEVADTYRLAREARAHAGKDRIPVLEGAASSRELGKETDVTRALAAALKEETLTILAIGPLTNIATVLQRHPEVESHIRELVAVAGRRPGQRFVTGTVNPNAHRDFNFEQDPGAFKVVLRSSVPLTLAPFEISSKVWIREPDLEQLKKGGEATRWLIEPARHWLALWKETFGVDGFNPFDTLAVAYLTSPAEVKCERLPIAIRELPDDSTEKRMQGTRVNRKPYLLVSKDLDPSRQAKYCYEAAPQLKEELIARVAASGGQ